MKFRWEIAGNTNHLKILEEFYHFNKYYMTEQTKDAVLDAIECMKHVIEERKNELKGSEEIENDINRYRWHDLKTDPTDLPDVDDNGESDLLLVTCGEPSNVHWEQAYWSSTSQRWNVDDVQAWMKVKFFDRGKK